MRRGVIFSSLLLAGLAQVAPAAVQKPAKPAAAPAKSGAPVLATPDGQVMDQARQLAEGDLAAAPDAELKPARIDPNAARKRDFVPPRLAAAPTAAAGQPEAKPVVAAVAKPQPEPAATEKPELAERKEAPHLAPAAQAPEAQPALAANDADQHLSRADRDPVVKPVHAERPYEPAPAVASAEHGDPAVVPRWKQRPWAPKPVRQAASAPAAEPNMAPAEADTRPDYARAERIVRDATARADGGVEISGAAASAPAAEAPRAAEVPAPAEEPAQVADAAPAADTAGDAVDTGREVLHDADRAVKAAHGVGRAAEVLGGGAAEGAARAGDDRDDRPVYADDQRSEGPARAEGERGGRPVYADDDRDAAPVYADDDMRGYPVEERDARPVYAGDDREVSYPAGRRDRFEDGRWGGRYAAVDYCDEQRFDGLDRAVRRAAAVGSIDWRTARDIEDEIHNGEDLQQSYCETGMNQWRQRRLEQQYAQIEDRLRYERGGRWH